MPSSSRTAIIASRALPEHCALSWNPYDHSRPHVELLTLLDVKALRPAKVEQCVPEQRDLSTTESGFRLLAPTSLLLMPIPHISGKGSVD